MIRYLHVTVAPGTSSPTPTAHIIVVSLCSDSAKSPRKSSLWRRYPFRHVFNIVLSHDPLMQLCVFCVSSALFPSSYLVLLTCLVFSSTPELHLLRQPGFSSLSALSTVPCLFPLIPLTCVSPPHSTCTSSSHWFSPYWSPIFRWVFIESSVEFSWSAAFAF